MCIHAGSYLDDCAVDACDQQYLAGMRQLTAYAAQFTFAVVVAAGSLAADLSDQHTSILAVSLCGVWYAFAMPHVLRSFREKPARRSRTDAGATSIVRYSFLELGRELRTLYGYPEAVKLLLLQVVKLTAQMHPRMHASLGMRPPIYPLEANLS